MQDKGPSNNEMGMGGGGGVLRLLRGYDKESRGSRDPRDFLVLCVADEGMHIAYTYGFDCR